MNLIATWEIPTRQKKCVKFSDSTTIMAPLTLDIQDLDVPPLPPYPPFAEDEDDSDDPVDGNWPSPTPPPPPPPPPPGDDDNDDNDGGGGGGRRNVWQSTGRVRSIRKSLSEKSQGGGEGRAGGGWQVVGRHRAEGVESGRQNENEGKWWDTTGTGGPVGPINYAEQYTSDIEMGVESPVVSDPDQELPFPLDQMTSIRSRAKGNANLDAVILNFRDLSVMTGRAEDEPESDVDMETGFIRYSNQAINPTPENGPEFAMDSRRIRPHTLMPAPNRKPPRLKTKENLLIWLRERIKGKPKEEIDERYLQELFLECVQTYLEAPTEEPVEDRSTLSKLFSLEGFLPSPIST
ncbi:hypothetical protein F4776DRAFT_476191 [Hypoxylon sp. NC0597]|nr:hypothetical protein F4776DRAFT_476191 [Hypoxylon sp. NC0597]